MSQISALIAGKNKNYDYQLSALARLIINPGVSGASGLEVTPGSVASGEAFILCTRTNGQQIMLHYQNTTAVTIDTTGTKKVWIGVDQSVIDNGSSNAIDGTGIATIQTGASYPAGNYIPLASITSGTITDVRETITFLPILGKGYETNKHKIINRSTGNEELKNITDGSTILSADKVLLEKASGDYEVFPVSTLQNSIAGLTSEYPAVQPLVANDFGTYTELSTTGSTTMKVGATTSQTSFPALATGLSSDKLSVVINKVGTPGDLVVRIETDNGSGSPSGTLVNANATATISNLAIFQTTYNYTFTFPASINLGADGTPVHVVFRVGAGVIDGANNYDITVNGDFPAIHQTSTGSGTDVTATRGMTINTLPSGAYDLYNDFTISSECMLKSFYIYWSFTGATRVKVIKLSALGGSELQTMYDVSFGSATLSNSFYTLASMILLKPGDYRIRVIGNGTYSTISAPTGVTNSAHATWYSIQTLAVTQIVTQSVAYTLLSTIKQKFLSKSKADKTQNANVYCGITDGVSAGQFPKIKKDGYMTGFAGLTKGTTYYLSNTGVISSTAGTVSKVLGVAISTTTIRLDSAINAS